MCIGKKRLTISLVLIASFVLSAGSITGQTTAAPTNDWSRLTAVESGSKLVIKLKNGKTVEGKVVSVSATAVSISIKGKPVELKRDDVRSVHQVMTKSASKATLIGLGVGAGAGAAAGAAASSSDTGFDFDKFDKAVTAGLTVVGAGAGALTGYLLGRRGGKRVLMYEAGQP